MSISSATPDQDLSVDGSPLPDTPIRTLVLMGASGDLANRLLMPALGALLDAEPERRGLALVGAGAEDWDDATWRERLESSLTSGKVARETIDALLADKERLTSVLTYHVVSGKLMAADIVKSNGARPKTVNGLPLDIVVRGGKVSVSGVNVVTADVQASNGVIHVVNGVLTP